jgi:ribosomal protein L11 methyltransferase
VEGAQQRYDFVAANILTYVIVGLLDDIKTVMKPGGIFVGSGILDENQDTVVAKMKEVGFGILEVAMKEQWVALAGRYEV